MTTRPEITVRRALAHLESGEFTFIPHSERADTFLFNQFNTYVGDRDLTYVDAIFIVARARRRGIEVLDLIGLPGGER
jgi:hypothetical protein